MKAVIKGFLLPITVLFAAIALMAVYPELDPTSYLPYATRCTRISEGKAVDIARDKIAKSVGFLVPHFGEPSADIKAAKVVQFVDLRPSAVFSYSVIFQTSGGHLLEINIGPECGREISYPGKLLPPI